MGRYREYSDNADRQRAYRQRKAEEQAAGRTRSSKRQPVSAKLVKVLGYLGSDNANERDVAARTATRMLKEAGLTWWDVLDTDERP